MIQQKHSSTHIGDFVKEDGRLDHRGSCDGNLKCPRCHRRMCNGCVINDAEYEKLHAKGHKGECLICAEMFTEDEIILWAAPKNSKEIEIENLMARVREKHRLKHPEGLYRMIRIGEE